MRTTTKKPTPIKKSVVNINVTVDIGDITRVLGADKATAILDKCIAAASKKNVSVAVTAIKTAKGNQ